MFEGITSINKVLLYVPGKSNYYFMYAVAGAFYIIPITLLYHALVKFICFLFKKHYPFLKMWGYSLAISSVVFALVIIYHLEFRSVKWLDKELWVGLDRSLPLFFNLLPFSCSISFGALLHSA